MQTLFLFSYSYLEMEYNCEICGRAFLRSDNYHQHARGHKEEKNFICNKCSKAFKRKEHMQHHKKNCNWQQQQPSTSGSGLRRKETPIFAPPPLPGFIQWKQLFQLLPLRVEYADLIGNSVKAMKYRYNGTNKSRRAKACKFNMSLHVIFENATDSSIVMEHPIVLVSEQMEVYEDTDIDKLLSISCRTTG